MRPVTRVKACLSCGNSELIPVVDLGHQYPVCFPDEREPAEVAELVSLRLMMCADSACALVQLDEHMAPEDLYREEYWYRSGVNQSMVRALQDVVTNAAMRQPVGRGDWVLDIGANDGTSLRHWRALNPGLMLAGVDPAKAVFPEAAAVADLAVNDFFPDALRDLTPLVGRTSVITAIAMAYDLPDPNAFFSAIRVLLSRSGLFVMQVGYLGDMLRMNSFDQVCHEHIQYYSLTALTGLLTRAGLVVEDVEWNQVNGGSIRLYVRKDESGAAPGPRVLQLLHEEELSGMHKKQAYDGLMVRLQSVRTRLHDIVDPCQGRAVIYGASTKGLTLMQYFGFDHEHFDFAVERSQEKIGRFYGRTGIQMLAEDDWKVFVASGNCSRLAMVLPWHFKEGILERETWYREVGGKFLFPLPSGEVF